MALEIFKLVGSVMVDSEKADKSLEKTDKKASSLGQTLSKGVKTAGKFALGLGAAAVGVGAAVWKMAKDHAAAADVIDKASIRMNISAESYQELQHVANLTGVSISDLEKAAKKLEGTDLNLDQALDELFAIEDQAERTTRATELFGTSVAYNMAPLLQSSAEDMAAMREEARELGLVMSNDAVAGGAAMNDMFYKVEASMGTVKNELMTDLMPVVQKVLEWIITHMPEIRATVKKVFDEIKPLIQGLMPVLEKLFQAAGVLWEKSLKPVLNGIIKFLDGVFSGDWSKTWEGLTEAFKGVWEGMKEIFRKPINWIISKLNSFIDSVNTIQVPDWVPGVGGKGLNLKHIPTMETGGVLERGQVGFLEGNGAEAVVPLEKNKKWISAVANDMQGAGIGGGNTEKLLAGILDALEDLNRKQIVLDTGKMVGALADPMDRRLGMMAAQKARA